MAKQEAKTVIFSCSAIILGSRLLMNLVLLKRGYPLLNIFNDEKLLYYLVLRKVDATKRPKSFVEYLFSTYIRQYEDYVKK